MVTQWPPTVWHGVVSPTGERIGPVCDEQEAIRRAEEFDADRDTCDIEEMRELLDLNE